MTVSQRARPKSRTDGWAPDPVTAGAFPSYQGVHGFAEIKPHKPAEILKGLAQLHTRRQAQPSRQVFLITYHYELPATSPLSLRAFVLRPDPRVEASPPPPPARRTPAELSAWLVRLGTWWVLDRAVPHPTYDFTTWRRQIGPAPFGHLVEAVLRSRFLGRFDTGPKRLVNTTDNILPKSGADVSWLEMADFLQELANELGAVDRR